MQGCTLMTLPEGRMSGKTPEAEAPRPQPQTPGRPHQYLQAGFGRTFLRCCTSTCINGHASDYAPTLLDLRHAESYNFFALQPDRQWSSSYLNWPEAEYVS